MKDYATLKILLTLVREGDKESFRNLQKTDNDYPDIFFDIVSHGLKKNPYMIRECMTDDFYTRHVDFFCEFVREQPLRISSIPSSAIMKNISIAENALVNDGSNIRHIPKQVVLNNMFLLKKALCNNTLALNCASRAYQLENKDFIVERLRIDPRGLKNVSYELEEAMGSDFDDILISYPDALSQLSIDRLLKRRDTVISSFINDPSVYKSLAPDVKIKFAELAEIAVVYDQELFQYVPREVLSSDINLARKCSLSSKNSAERMPFAVLLEHEDIYLNCLENSTKPGRIITLDLLTKHKELVLDFVKRNPKAIDDVSDIVLIKNPELVYVAVENDYTVYEDLSNAVKDKLEKAAVIAYKKNPSSIVWIPFPVLAKIGDEIS